MGTWQGYHGATVSLVDQRNPFVWEEMGLFPLYEVCDALAMAVNCLISSDFLRLMSTGCREATEIGFYFCYEQLLSPKVQSRLRLGLQYNPILRPRP